MIDRLDYIKLIPDTILDIGSGMGIDAKLLKSRFNKASIIELDSSINVLKQYRTKTGLLKKLFIDNQKHICADGVSLPIKSQSVNLVWSNLCLPYINDMEVYFREIRRVLALGGLFLVTGFGVDSLQQLRDVGLHTYNFPDMHIIGDILVKLGFSHPVTDLEYITLEYDNIEQLLADIRILGSGSGIRNRKFGFSSRDYNDLSNRFAKITKNGKIPLTLEVYYAHGWKDNVTLDLPDDKKIIQFHPKGA
jgi:malonyl-CoA O-methyltransferase